MLILIYVFKLSTSKLFRLTFNKFANIFFIQSIVSFHIKKINSGVLFRLPNY